MATLARFGRTLLFASLPAYPCVQSSAHADDLFFDDVPIVLTASRLAQSPLDAPAPVTVIDREMIEASGFTEIHDLLRLVPGFLVADWPGNSPTVTNHGLGDGFDRRIKVLIDGRTVNASLYGNTDWHDLPVRVDDIERIEVVRGPHGGSYGANAFQGVVHILTRSPVTEEGLTLISRAGKDGFRDHGVRLNGPTGRTVDWRLSASRRSAFGFRDYTAPGGDTGVEKSTHRTVANVQASAQTSATDELRAQFGLVDGAYRRGFPDGSPEAAIYPLRDEPLRSHYLQLGWKRSFDAESEFDVQYAYQQHFRETFLPVHTKVDARRHDLEGRFATRLSPEWHLLFGLAARHESVHSEAYFSSDDALRRDYWQSFASLTWHPLAPVRINFGATFEDHAYSGHLLSPRLALNYALGAESALRLSTGRAWRAPSLLESDAKAAERDGDGKIVEMYYHAGAPLDPEEVRYVELGYVARLHRLGLAFDARVFRERYHGYIDDQACRYVATGNKIQCPFPSLDPDYKKKAIYFLNTGGLTMRGGEFTVDWRRPGWGGVVLSQAFIDIETDGPVLDDELPRSAPAAMTSLLLIKELPARWRASLGYYHNHQTAWVNDGGRVPARDRFDLKLARNFGPADAANEIALTLQSTGGSYPEFDAERYVARPQAFVSLRLSL